MTEQTKLPHERQVEPLREVGGSAAFKRRIDRIYGGYLLGFLAFVLALAVLEQLGLPKRWIGAIFMLGTVGVYAGIGIVCRTTDADEYYVAGRRVPAMYNGMAIGADWMSAASFIGLAGTLYLSGFDGLAFVLGWTGGFVLVAMLLAPYLRQLGQFTIPDFLGERYGGHGPRAVGIFTALLCSFTYLVAQLYGVGLITAHLTGFAFEIGVFVGLGGILVCSFLGGMRAVTWTQVAQYIVLIVAYVVPVVWLSVKQTGVILPQAVYGLQLEKIGAAERRLTNDPRELEAIAVYRQRAEHAAAKLEDVPTAMQADRVAARQRLLDLRMQQAPLPELQSAARAVAALPANETAARRLYESARSANEARAMPLGGLPPHAKPYAGDPEGSVAERRLFDDSRRNFIALVFCLVVGTAGMPHVLVRFYTTPSVREARESVTWSLFFILLLYLTAPALAVLVKLEIFTNVVGLPFSELPAWIGTWAKVDPGLLSVTDINLDGVLQLGEMKMSGDMIVLAAPEIGGLPYVVSGMVAAGGLAAALSTADGLLLTITNALSHDLYYRMIDPKAVTSRRVTLSKMLLLVVAVAAAYVAAQRPADILFLVSAAFSLAAAGFFPALVLGIFWKRANAFGAVAGMVSGLVVTLYYMVRNQVWLRDALDVSDPVNLWLGIQPIAAGVFGVPVGFAVTVLVSLLTPPPGPGLQALVGRLRAPPRP